MHNTVLDVVEEGKMDQKMDDPAKDITEQSGSQTLAQGDFFLYPEFCILQCAGHSQQGLCIPGCGRTGNPDAMEQLIQVPPGQKVGTACVWVGVGQY